VISFFNLEGGEEVIWDIRLEAGSSNFDARLAVRWAMIEFKDSSFPIN
jgi:hypothetical protein